MVMVSLHNNRNSKIVLLAIFSQAHYKNWEQKTRMKELEETCSLTRKGAC